MIERSLRRDLPLHRIERRARLRADRAILLACIGVLLGLGLAALATTSPAALVAFGMTLTGACLGVIVVRGLLTVAAAGRTYRPTATRSRRYSR